MFERFTDSARAVVRGALERAEGAGDGKVKDEHLFLVLLDAGGTPAAAALATLGVSADRDSVERSLAEARRRGGLSRADADALAGLGIDVTEVVSRVEQEHGEGALAGVEPVECGRGFFGQRRRGGSPNFTPNAKQVLEQSLREALERGDKHIGDEHLLLALTSRPGVVADVLAERGVSHADVRRVLARQSAAG